MKFNVRFNLRRKDKKQPQIIYMVCRWCGNRLVYPTGFSCSPKDWDVRAGRIRNVISEPDRNIKNDYLNQLKKAANSIYVKTIATKQPLTKEVLKLELDKWSGKVRADKPPFKEWIAEYIEKSSTRINPRTGRPISNRTVLEYKTTEKYLYEFEKLNNELLIFEAITVNTLIDFRDYLTTVKGFAVNNIAKHIDNLRQFLRAAKDDGYDIQPPVINPSKFYIAREKPNHIYLNNTDLKRIEGLHLTGIKDEVRDLFLIGCNTGLRISDFTNIKPYNIKGGNINIVQYKTNNPISIPINKTVQKILDKYHNELPAAISAQKINDYLKIICKDAGLTEQVEKRQTKGGKLKIRVCQKWELVTSHTGRRSFASNAVRAGYPIQAIMRITGHRKEDVFLRYVQLTKAEYNEMMKEKMSLTL